MRTEMRTQEKAMLGGKENLSITDVCHIIVVFMSLTEVAIVGEDGHHR